MSKKNSADNFNSEYETLPLADKSKIQKKTNISMPNEEDVKQAKDWVDSNEK